MPNFLDRCDPDLTQLRSKIMFDQPHKLLTVAYVALAVGAAVVIVGLNVLNWALV